MPITPKIIDLYLGLGRTLIPEQNQSAIKGHKKGKTYSRDQLLKFVKRGYNLGWVLADRDVVLDVDPRNGGKRSLAKLLRKIDSDDFSIKYSTVITGGGGLHYYMMLPRQVTASHLRTEIKPLPGIELLHSGQKVTIAGSKHHKTGKPYRIDSQSPYDVKPKPIPLKLLKLYFKQNGSSPPAELPAGKRKLPAITSKKLYQLLKCLPVDDYAVHEDWLHIMMASHSATEGKGLKAFLKWSLSDPTYAGDSEQITARWNSLKPNDGVTVLTLMKEVRRYNKTIQLDDTNYSDLERRIVQSLLDRRFEQSKYLVHAADQRYWHYVGTHWRLLLPNVVSRYVLDEIEAAKRKDPEIKRGSAALLINSERLLRAVVASDRNLTRNEHRTQSIVNTLNYEIWIDETTGKIRRKKHKPENYLTSCLAVEYDKKAKCPRYDKALEQIFANDQDCADVIRHYWEINGYAIQSKKNIPIWVMFQGSGANGKKVLTQTPLALAGDAVCCKAIDDLDTRRNNHALADLPGKLVILDDDVDSNAVLPDGMLKKISENKMLVANPKGSPEFRFENTALVMMAANNWPRTKDISLGMRRRAMVFHLKRTFAESEQDLDLVDYVTKHELAGVLNRCLEGFKRLRKRGNFLVPESCKKAAEVWFSSSSQVHQFIDDNLEPNKKHRMTFGLVWDRYRSWAVDNGISRPYTRNYFKRLLQDLGYRIKVSTGNKLYVYGYELKDLGD